LHGPQPLSFVNGSVAVSGYRRSSGPGGSAPWYCTFSLEHCSVRSASSKSRDLVSVLLPSYFFSLGSPFPPSLGLRPAARLQAHPPPRPGLPGVRPPFTSLPPRTRGLPWPNPPHVLPLAPRPGLYGPGTFTLVVWLRFDDVYGWGSLKAFAADGLSPVFLLRIWYFWFFSLLGFFLGVW